ncbi:hypothetical protein [Rhodohalobacter sp. 614A]|uniref:hypothetical protein n=1 Tax=Rhodohalobacter sp. 614A TaxID=2908649 RepID=UPI001F41CEBF|nr:hypothetical protein [Rhodohalobacter sp. 614A]
MNNYLPKLSIVTVLLGIFFYSCSSDSSPELPTITLDAQSVEAKAGDMISIGVNYTTPEGFDHLMIEKKLDGDVLDTENITNEGGGTYQFEYEVLVEDSEGILSFTFTIFDETDASASKDLVVAVELTKEQLLTNYDWLLSEEIRQKTGENDISEAYTDDVYRFHADGSYDKSIGEKQDDFGDAWYNHCYWNLDDQDVLIMTRTGAFGEDVRDTLYVNSVDTEELRADVIYYGLDAFNTGTEDVPYESQEEYVKVFVAQPKGNNFDPYKPGSADDAGPAGSCLDVEF